MGYVEKSVAESGAQVTIASAATGEDYAGTIQTRAFYDPEMTRAKA